MQTEVRETRFLSSAQVQHDREKDGDLYYDTDDDFIDDTVRPSVCIAFPEMKERDACVRGVADGLCSTGLRRGGARLREQTCKPALGS